MPTGPKEFCLRGHSDWATKSDGTRRCRVCHNAQKRASNARSRGSDADSDRMARDTLKCGHAKGNKTEKGCRLCIREYQRQYMATYRQRRKPTPITKPYMTGRSGGTATATMHQRRAAAKREVQAVFWKRRLMGRLVEEQAEKVIYRSPYGYEGRLPRVDGWLLVLPAQDVPGLPDLPAVA